MNRDTRANDHDQAEEWLNRALAEYAQVEPRAGFEGRVLARLRNEREDSRWKTWWRLSFAFCTAAMFLLTLLWLRQPEGRQDSGRQIAKVAPEIAEPAEAVKGNQGEVGQVTLLSQRPRTRARARGAPKREHFPTALPLTDQERMLAQYVQDFPDRAALVARAQTDLRKLNELEMGMPQPANDIKSSDPQE